jgi:Na+-translocating ferredoxin:NAD+ oxidoreductase RnfA subunit
MIPELLNRILDHNVVFGALIGLESMYVLTHTHQNGTFRLWLLLLPMLMLSSLTPLPISWISASLSNHHLFPFFITIVAAACATAMAEFHKKFNRRANEQEASFLFFASIAALCIVAAWHDQKSVSLASSVTSALSTWAGYGIGLAVFTSLGVRLHPFTVASRFGGIALLYATIAIIGLAMTGVMGIGSR